MFRACAAAIFCVAVFTGCFRPIVPGSGKTLPPADVRPGGERDSGNGSASTPALRKRVSDKQTPATLLSADSYHCTVTPARFNQIKIGEYAICAWTK
jgi:hypothetical protein